MSASDHLSELQFQVHRGIKIWPSDKLDTSALGMHWSASKDKAGEFATKHMDWPDRSGYRYEATVPVSAVETDSKRLGERGVANFHTIGDGTRIVRDPLGEQEVPVKEGAKIKVSARTKYTRLRNGQMRERTRRYNPPKEMTA